MSVARYAIKGKIIWVRLNVRVDSTSSWSIFDRYVSTIFVKNLRVPFIIFLSTVFKLQIAQLVLPTFFVSLTEMVGSYMRGFAIGSCSILCTHLR